MHERNLVRLARELDILRPSSAQDVEYRLRVQHELPGHIKDALPADSPVRFHATSLLATEGIVKTGELSSSVDRTGSASSYDTADQVSATMPDNVEISVESYLGLTNRNMCLPAGCLFMLLPKDADEAAAGNQQLMDNVYFKKNPKQLVGVLTSDENLPTVRAWFVENDLDPNKVQEFFQGVALLKVAQPQLEP